MAERNEKWELRDYNLKSLVEEQLQTGKPEIWIHSSEKFSEEVKLQMTEVIAWHFKETQQLIEYIEALEEIVIAEINLIWSHFPIWKIDRIKLEKNKILLTDSEWRVVAHFDRIKEK